MPNWIEGIFRARGSKENIKRFLLEALEPCVGYGKMLHEEFLKEISYEEDNYIEIEFKYAGGEEEKEEYVKTLYIEGTHRQFIENTRTIEASKTKNGEFQLALDYRGAWSIDDEHFIELAKKYEVDIKVNGYERGMEFESLFEVNRKGTVICDCFKQYSDYTWDCLMPLLGG